LQINSPRSAIFELGRVVKRYRQSVIAFVLTLAAFTAMYIARHQTGGKPPQQEGPFDIVQAFVKASYARDYKQASQQISSVDQRVMDEWDYASEHGKLSGFALELAKKLAGDMDIWLIDRKINLDQAHYSVGYKIRVYEEVPSPPADWDEDKLNALSRAEQERFVERLQRFKTNGKMITITGRETFDLVLEQGRWKIFFDWATRTRIKFRVALPQRAGLDVRVLHNDFFAKQDEPFTIVFMIKNISKHQLLARIVHHVEPKDMGRSCLHDRVWCPSATGASTRRRPGAFQRLFAQRWSSRGCARLASLTHST
jgi:hypothetical protein